MGQGPGDRLRSQRLVAPSAPTALSVIRALKAAAPQAAGALPRSQSRTHGRVFCPPREQARFEPSLQAGLRHSRPAAALFGSGMAARSSSEAERIHWQLEAALPSPSAQWRSWQSSCGSWGGCGGWRCSWKRRFQCLPDGRWTLSFPCLTQRAGEQSQPPLSGHTLQLQSPRPARALLASPGQHSWALDSDD